MNKISLELEVKPSVDVFGLSNFIASIKAVKKAYIVTGQRLRIYFDEDKLSAKKLMKIIAGYGKQQHGNRKRNVSSVREVTT